MLRGWWYGLLYGFLQNVEIQSFIVIFYNVLILSNNQDYQNNFP